jgi:hypothetical protein
VVTEKIATAPMTDSIASCPAWGSDRSNRSSPTPTAIDSTTASATPSHIGRRLAPLLRRKAAMIPTINAASSPSRKPITSVASTNTLLYGQNQTIGKANLTKESLGVSARNVYPRIYRQYGIADYWWESDEPVRPRRPRRGSSRRGRARCRSTPP